MTEILTLQRLRWFALLGQSIVIVTVSFFLRAPLPLIPIAIILALFATSNWLLGRISVLSATSAFSPGPRLITHSTATERICGITTVVDVIFLTVLLALCGGPANPFSVLYLVHVMLAAVITSKWWARCVVAASSVGFACLFMYFVPLPAQLGGHDHQMMAGADTGSFSIHLQGMWLAYTISAIVIAEIVSGVSIALKQEREKQAHSSRFLGLAALAAGAAHELGNPLGTIRLAASELEIAGRKQSLAPALMDDIRLINQEVLRSQSVLNRLSVSAGELRGEAVLPMPATQFIDGLMRRIAFENISVGLDLSIDDAIVEWPIEAMSQALLQLISNAKQASVAASIKQALIKDPMIDLQMVDDDSHIVIRVRDRGVGMTKSILARISEPFFTTRGAEGMGLGVFIARSLIEDMGGELSFQSKVDLGTVAYARIPKVLSA